MYSNGERKESKHKWQIVDAANSQPLDYKHNHEVGHCYLNVKNKKKDNNLKKKSISQYNVANFR